MGRGDEGSYQVEGYGMGYRMGYAEGYGRCHAVSYPRGYSWGGREVEIPAGLGADTVGGREVSAHVPRPRLVNGGRDR